MEHACLQGESISPLAAPFLLLLHGFPLLQVRAGHSDWESGGGHDNNTAHNIFLLLVSFHFTSLYTDAKVNFILVLTYFLFIGYTSGR